MIPLRVAICHREPYKAPYKSIQRKGKRKEKITIQNTSEKIKKNKKYNR